MQYISHYQSPLGTILLAADEQGLTGLWFEGQKHYPGRLDQSAGDGGLPVFDGAKRWLDVYFAGQQPEFAVPVHLVGTEFQLQVWDLLQEIPYGKTMTYGHIAKLLDVGSAQAVGGAVARNPISIIVPCHRVMGAKDALTGYAGGLDKKLALLKLEGIIL